MSIAEYLAEAKTDPSAVTLDSLGTVAEIAAEASGLAADPLAPYLAYAFCSQLRDGLWTDEHAEALLSFAAGLAHQHSYLALRETADILLDDERALSLVAATLHDALLPGEVAIASSPLLAGLQLDIALEVAAKTTVAPYRLLALLTGPVQDYPEDFNDPLARALGVAADIWTTPAERARFAGALATLAERGSEDAAYESAVGQLRDALMQTGKEELVGKIRDARDGFEAIARQIEGREDAAAFAQTCTALIAFDEVDKTTLSMSAQAARAIADQRALLTYGMHSRHQATARHSAQLAWISLAWQLETAATELEEDAFLDTWVAVDAIIKVYEADRQFTNLRTVTSIIQPRLVNEIAQREAMAHQLERAVTIDRRRDEPELPPEIYELLDLVHLGRAARREPSDAPEESSPSEPYLRALLGPASTLLGDLESPHRARLEEAARQTFVGSFAGDRPTNELIDRLCAGLVANLSENPAFVGMAKADFSLLVVNTVRFLVHVGDNSQPYTARIPQGGAPPLEADIQNHFHEFLNASDLAGRVGKEHSNIAGGRADVIATFDGARRYVTEVKRELSNAARASLEAAYLAQAVEYQSTNEPLGQLLVLDLTDHTDGTPHINDSIWVAHRRDAAGTVTNSTVVAVVRGNRPTPSAMR
ncbi:hypothetical protein [Lacisediminihabitans profunda]|uniref:Uncharacterized protein n=1 Tax=Lacisediminihabitans profunda TaxID=2594790 RepID=A0A5C8UN08_9MICO|nr:hypothetical protein [Lacisediminihabitans profunda]TXN29775.1 hypothetical protein FVP33_11540 [Lacisediminihabitans profunda]